ncbi:hypothetical protein C8R45DRAFT_921247 [Mycena sanguinolenta]|nr:hypothetical protein C8R45DRAFT_921247 [Mycena sanguinolenta]
MAAAVTSVEDSDEQVGEETRKRAKPRSLGISEGSQELRVTATLWSAPSATSCAIAANASCRGFLTQFPSIWSSIQHVESAQRRGSHEKLEIAIMPSTSDCRAGFESFKERKILPLDLPIPTDRFKDRHFSRVSEGEQEAVAKHVIHEVVCKTQQLDDLSEESSGLWSRVAKNVKNVWQPILICLFLSEVAAIFFVQYLQLLQLLPVLPNNGRNARLNAHPWSPAQVYPWDHRSMFSRLQDMCQHTLSVSKVLVTYLQAVETDRIFKLTVASTWAGCEGSARDKEDKDNAGMDGSNANKHAPSKWSLKRMIFCQKDGDLAAPYGCSEFKGFILTKYSEASMSQTESLEDFDLSFHSGASVPPHPHQLQK